MTWNEHRIYQPLEVSVLLDQLETLGAFNDYGAIRIVRSAGPFKLFLAGGLVSRNPTILYTTSSSSEPDASSRFLFHHYLSHVAPNMMPFQDSRNPWLSLYPLLAKTGKSLEQRALFNAMLAQAAGNLACMDANAEKMSVLTIKFYAKSLQYLREAISKERKDFSTILASVLTLIMAEESHSRGCF